MKKMIKYCLITAAILFGTKVTFGMEATAGLKAKFPIPQVDLTISNETKDNFVLKADNKILTGIKAGDTKKKEIPMKLEGRLFWPQSPLKLVNTNTKKEYSIALTISKGKHILFYTALQRPMTEDETINFLKTLFDVTTEEEAKKELKTWGHGTLTQIKERFPFDITEIKEYIDDVDDKNIKKIQDSYKIELILKGDDLAQSILDYIGSWSLR